MSPTAADPRLDALPEDLRRAQQALHLPEVQQILKTLAQYNLGVYMPHMHDEKTGAFQRMPASMTQVEDGLRVSFQTLEACERQGPPAIEVGWVWRDDRAVPGMTCTARCVMMGTMHTTGHDTSD